MKYAIVKLQGKQYRVEEGQELTIDRLASEEKEKLNLSDVLLYSDGKKVEIGTPNLKDVSVKASVLKHLRGEKIRVATFKAKSRYRKTRGHRQEESVLKIESISAA